MSASFAAMPSGGVTTSQGVTLPSNAGIQRSYRGIVRNVTFDATSGHNCIAKSNACKSGYGIAGRTSKALAG